MTKTEWMYKIILTTERIWQNFVKTEKQMAAMMVDDKSKMAAMASQWIHGMSTGCYDIEKTPFERLRLFTMSPRIMKHHVPRHAAQESIAAKKMNICITIASSSLGYGLFLVRFNHCKLLLSSIPRGGCLFWTEVGILMAIRGIDQTNLAIVADWRIENNYAHARKAFEKFAFCSSWVVFVLLRMYVPNTEEMRER